MVWKRLGGCAVWTVVVLLATLSAGCALRGRAWQEQGGEAAKPEHEGPSRHRSARSWTPLQLSWTHDLQMFCKDRAVHGLRLSLITADNRAVWGADFGLGLVSSLGAGGLAVAGLVNSSAGPFYGLQVAGVFNYNDGGRRGKPTDCPTLGVQLAILGNKARLVGGWQIGGINFAERVYGQQLGLGSATIDFYGIQSSCFVNMASSGHGLQLAAYNCVGDLTGVQLGLVNQASHGFQIGLININENGFLPVFPFFNF